MFKNKKSNLLLYIVTCCFIQSFASCHQNATKINDETIEISDIPDIPIPISFELDKSGRIILTGKIEKETWQFLLDGQWDHDAIEERYIAQICDTIQNSVWKMYENTYETVRCKKRLNIQFADYNYIIDTIIINSPDFLGKAPNRHGIIGTRFFYDKIVKIDFDNNQILLYKELPTEYKDYIPFELFGSQNKGNDRRVRLNFNTYNQETITLEFLFDLGARYSDMENEIKNKIDRTLMPEDSTNFASVLLFRGFHMDRNDTVISINSQTGESIDYYKIHNFHGTIGMDIIKQYNLIFDYNGKHIYLKPNNNFKKFKKFNKKA
jgi:hypothetical protein